MDWLSYLPEPVCSLMISTVVQYAREEDVETSEDEFSEDEEGYTTEEDETSEEEEEEVDDAVNDENEEIDEDDDTDEEASTYCDSCLEEEEICCDNKSHSPLPPSHLRAPALPARRLVSRRRCPAVDYRNPHYSNPQDMARRLEAAIVPETSSEWDEEENEEESDVWSEEASPEQQPQQRRQQPVRPAAPSQQRTASVRISANGSVRRRAQAPPPSVRPLPRTSAPVRREVHYTISEDGSVHRTAGPGYFLAPVPAAAAAVAADSTPRNRRGPALVLESSEEEDEYSEDESEDEDEEDDFETFPDSDDEGEMPEDEVKQREAEDAQRATAPSTALMGACTICHEANIVEPAMCKNCRNVVGCYTCVARWMRASAEPQCPLCREKWTVDRAMSFRLLC